MNRSSNTISRMAVLVGILGLLSCEKDELGSIESNVPPVIYLTQIVDGQMDINADNVSINKTEKSIVKIFGVHRSGIQGHDDFSVEVSVNTDNLPAGTTPLQAGEYTLSASATGTDPVERIEVAAGESSAPLFLTVTKTVLDAHPGEQLALNVQISNPSRYELNPALSMVTIVIEVDDFKEVPIVVTSAYLKNPGGTETPFQRLDNDGTRFGILKDWLVNDPVKNIDGGTHGGFDSYGGGAYMAMERWGTPSIPNGKIYQTVTLPAGKYQFEIDFQAHGISNEAYLAIAAGTTLPDVAEIATAIGYSPFSAPQVTVVLTEETEVSIGVVANLINDQQYFRARSVKLSQYRSVFD
jgi:hypothetical protein